MLQLRILTNIFKIYKIQKDKIHIVLNIVNLKNRVYFTFYRETCVTILQKAYSFEQVMQHTPKHVQGNW